MMHHCQAKEWVKPDPESCGGVLDRTYITLHSEMFDKYLIYSDHVSVRKFS